MIKRGTEDFSLNSLGGYLSPVLNTPTPRAIRLQRSAGSFALPPNQLFVAEGGVTTTSSLNDSRAVAVGDGIAFVALSDVMERSYTGAPLLEHADIEKDYPRYPDIENVSLTEDERGMYIDLRPYLNPTPVTAHVHTPLETAYGIFKGLDPAALACS